MNNTNNHISIQLQNQHSDIIIRSILHRHLSQILSNIISLPILFHHLVHDLQIHEIPQSITPYNYILMGQSDLQFFYLGNCCQADGFEGIVAECSGYGQDSAQSVAYYLAAILSDIGFNLLYSFLFFLVVPAMLLRQLLASAIFKQVSQTVTNMCQIQYTFGLLQGNQADSPRRPSLHLQSLLNLLINLHNNHGHTSTKVLAIISPTLAFPIFILFLIAYNPHISHTFGRNVTNFVLTCLPPCPSKTPNNVDLGQLGKKQSCTKDATGI